MCDILGVRGMGPLGVRRLPVNGGLSESGGIPDDECWNPLGCGPRNRKRVKEDEGNIGFLTIVRPLMFQ